MRVLCLRLIAGQIHGEVHYSERQLLNWCDVGDRDVSTIAIPYY